MEAGSRKIAKTRQKEEFREIRRQQVGFHDSVNPEKTEHLRAASAEEALIAYLMKNPGSAPEILKALPPEKFITEFNRRVYKRIMGRMKEEKSVSFQDLSEGFSPEEYSYLSGILARNDGILTEKSDAEEYINIILQENEKQSLGSAAEAPPGEIESYLEKLRQQQK